MFVIQRVLETEGKLTLLDQNRVIRPHPYFRLFATTNTVGLGDTTGLYHGTQQINQGQMDRWNIVVTLNYLPAETEARIVLAKSGEYDHEGGRAEVERMIKVAELTRQRLRQRRHLDRDEPAHGDQLGAERADLRRCRLRLPPHLPQQMRRGGAGDGRRILSARVRQGSARKRGRARPDAADGRRQSPRSLPPGAGRGDAGDRAAMPRSSSASPATCRRVGGKSVKAPMPGRALGADGGRPRRGASPTRRRCGCAITMRALHARDAPGGRGRARGVRRGRAGAGRGARRARAWRACAPISPGSPRCGCAPIRWSGRAAARRCRSARRSG